MRRHFGIIPVCFVVVGSILGILIYAHWEQHLSRSFLIMPATRSKIQNQRRWITADPFFYSASLRPRLLPRHKTTLLTTKKCSRYYHLLILVASAPDNFDRRNNIRKTWARDTKLRWPRWKTFFLLGQTPTSNVSKLLLKEDKAFRDLVRGDYNEHYWNQLSQNNETAAMLLSQTSPVGDKLFLMRFLLFQQICIYVGHVSENTLLMSVIESQSIVFYKNIHLYRIYVYIDIYSLLDI